MGSVPAVTGTDFFAASDPAAARTGTMIQNREMNMHRPKAMLLNGLLAPYPAKAEPLLFDAEEKA